jgi:hypothetical protein
LTSLHWLQPDVLGFTVPGPFFPTLRPNNGMIGLTG